MPPVTAKLVGSWLTEFLNGYESSSFHKAGDHVIANERDLLKILKFFLLAKYPQLRPEIPAFRNGRIDFGFGKLALEVAVKNKSGKGNLIVGQNAPEMVKLRKHRGQSVLALIHMEKGSKDNLDKLIDGYRQHSLGQGNHARVKPITLLIIARGGEKYDLKKYVLRAQI